MIKRHPHDGGRKIAQTRCFLGDEIARGAEAEAVEQSSVIGKVEKRHENNYLHKY